MKAESRMRRMSTIKGLLERPFLLAPVLRESQYQPDVRKSKQMEAGMDEGGVHRVPASMDHSLRLLSQRVLWAVVQIICRHGVAAAEHASERCETPPGAARGIQPP